MSNEKTSLLSGSSCQTQEICGQQGSINANEEAVVQNKPLRNRKRIDTSLLRLLGAIICIAIAIATWVTMAEKLQGLNEHYKRHQYFVTYWVHSCYSVLYIIWKIWVLFPGGCACNKVGEGALIFDKKLLFWSGFIALSGFLSAYLWYISLTQTNIPANTAIYQSGAALVFIISVPLLKERVTLLKFSEKGRWIHWRCLQMGGAAYLSYYLYVPSIHQGLDTIITASVICVIISIAGVSLVAFFSTADDCSKTIPIHNGTNGTQHVGYFSDNDSEHTLTRVPHGGGSSCAERSTALGYILLVVSIFLYAIFETFYKKFGTKKDDPAAVFNGIRFVGIVGIHSVVWMWPPILILHYAGVEPFEWPELKDFKLLVLNATLDVVFNGALLVSIALSSPLFVTVGTILAIPTSVVVDWIVQGELLAWQAFVGIALIILGFTGFAFSEFVATRREHRHKQQRDKMELVASCRDRLCNSSKSTETDPLIQSGQVENKKPPFSLKLWIKQNIYWI